MLLDFPLPVQIEGPAGSFQTCDALTFAAPPAVPAAAEWGFSKFDAVNWSGLVAPAHTSDARSHASMRKRWHIELRVQ
jgi:hypothetical protein